MAVNGCALQNNSWAELWDQTDAVAGHTQKGVEFLERIGNFAKERALIEEEYAAKLRTLSKKFLGRKKEDEEAAKNFTYVRSFASLLRELESLAGQHEVVGERIRKEVVPFIVTQAEVHRAQRKQCLSDLQSFHANLTGAMDFLFKAQKHYRKTFKEAEAAFLKYAKADKNMEISRLDLDKAKNNAQINVASRYIFKPVRYDRKQFIAVDTSVRQLRCSISEEAKHAYAQALQCANDKKNAHYSLHLPEALARMRAIDLERINDIKVAMEMCISSDIDVRPTIARCHEDMKKAVEEIDPIQDTAMVVEQFKTGQVYPPPIQFEDLGRPDNCLSGEPTHMDPTLKKGMPVGGKKDGKSLSRKQSMHQKIFGGGDKHRADTNTDYGQLPPHQRVQRLQAKVSELEREKEKLQQSRNGLAKMKQVYVDNPKMGNAADCDLQLVNYDKEIETISQQLTRFRFLLEDAKLQGSESIGANETPPSIRSGSSSSSLPPSSTQQSSQCCSHSEESLASSDGGGNIENRNGVRMADDKIHEECAVPALGTAIALFSFEGGTEGTIVMQEGEELLLIERDEGDGWMRVRRIATSVEGFVPSSYLRCNWYTAGSC